MTALATRPEPDAPAPAEAENRSLAGNRWAWLAVIMAVWVVVWKLTEGNDTLTLPGREHTDLHQNLTDFRDSVLASRDTNPIVQATYQLGEWFVSVFDWLSRMIAVPDFPRPVPQIGWLGVLAAAVWIGYAVANLRIAILVGAAFAAFGIFGYWSDSMDLLIITFIAVTIATLIGIPLAVYYGTGGKVGVGIITSILDFMQTMPTFVYLGPIVLFFGIGASAAVACTLVYALPPIIRIAGHGIRSVSPTTIEATDSSGQTARQRLHEGPAADGPRDHRGRPQPDDHGRAVDGHAGGVRRRPGARQAGAPRADQERRRRSVRPRHADRGHGDHARPEHDRGKPASREGRPRRALTRGSGGSCWLSVCWPSACASTSRAPTPGPREFPESEVGPKTADQVDRFFAWFTDTFDGLTTGIKDFVTTVLLNPMQSLLAESPWYVTAAALCAIAFVLGGGRALVSTAVCLAGIWFFDLWHDAMVTLNMVLVATLMVMVLAVVFGVWMARRRSVDLALRPLLDAGQTIPPFVYLIPVLALFGPTRFTAIVAGVVYAAPVAIKLVADGIQGVSPSTLEASRSTGCTTWQEITKVQLPMAALVPRARDEPGAALRAVHGRHRWPGRRRCSRLRRRARLRAVRGVGQGRGGGHHDRAARRDDRPGLPGRSGPADRREPPGRHADPRPAPGACAAAGPGRGVRRHGE